MADISLFDNTGKHGYRERGKSNCNGVTFVSMSVNVRNGEFDEDTGNLWAELRNVELNGTFVAWQETDSYEKSRELADRVSRLPIDWPVRSRLLLDLWAESGNFEKSRRSLDIPVTEARDIKRRFDKWQTVTKARAGK